MALIASVDVDKFNGLRGNKLAEYTDLWQRVVDANTELFAELTNSKTILVLDDLIEEMYQKCGDSEVVAQMAEINELRGALVTRLEEFAPNMTPESMMLDAATVGYEWVEEVKPQLAEDMAEAQAPAESGSCSGMCGNCSCEG